MNSLRLIAVAALLSSSAVAADKPAPAVSGTYVSDPAHSSVTWKISHLGLSSYTARFTKSSSELVWNVENPTASSIKVTIDPTSVRTDFPFPDKEDFDKKIGTGEDFLAGKDIRFVSTSVKATGENRGEVSGDLTFRGETHPATLETTFNGSLAQQPQTKTPKIGFSAVMRLKRSEWGVAPKIKSLGDDVVVIIETEFETPEDAAKQ